MTILEEQLQPRPLERAKIDEIATRAYQSLRRKIAASAKGVRQPRFQQVVHIETGATRLIPYVE